MKLQTDPTCVYSETLYRKKPHPRFCKDKSSRYSTYVIRGLPPTPISNPGATAIEAALSPYDGPDASKLLFFVALGDGSGRHRFSHNFSEHRRAVKRYIKTQKKEPVGLEKKGPLMNDGNEFERRHN